MGNEKLPGSSDSKRLNGRKTKFEIHTAHKNQPAQQLNVLWKVVNSEQKTKIVPLVDQCLYKLYG